MPSATAAASPPIPTVPEAVAGAVRGVLANPERLAHMGRKSRDLAVSYDRVRQLQAFVQAIEEAQPGMIGLVSFAVALLASLTLTIPVRRFALRVGMVDQPGHRKIHSQPIPLMGGVAMYAAVLLAMLFSRGGETLAQILAILAGATLVVVTGTLDDRGLLHHQVKLFVAMPIAASHPAGLGNPRARLFRVLAWNRRQLRRCRVDRVLDHRHHRLVQHSRLHGRPLRRRRGGGFALFRISRRNARPGLGQHSRRRGHGRDARIPALEFQSRPHLHG